MSDLEISEFSAEAIAANLTELGQLLQACVHDGASIGFVLPYSLDDAMGFWKDKVLPGVRGATRLMLVAMKDGRIAGTVQLGYDTMPNQMHRADVNKLMVHPDFRRQGIANRLMAEIEAHARRLGRSLMTLDTRTGDSAEPLYRSLGYVTSGVIPGFARDPFGSDRLDATTIMYKTL